MSFVKYQPYFKPERSSESKENQNLVNQKSRDPTELSVTSAYRQTLVDVRKNDNCGFRPSPPASEHHSVHKNLNEKTISRNPPKPAPKISQSEVVSRKRDIAHLDAPPAAKRQDVRYEKLIIERTDSDDQDVLDYGPGGHLELHEQTILANRYEVVKRLGNGVYGAVYMAMDRDECETVAIKVGRCGDAANANSIEEIKYTEIVKGSPNCVKLLNRFQETGTHGKHYVLVYEILGPNLYEILHKSNQSDLSSHRLKQFLKNILNGLVHIHQKCRLIHGDLKPANLMLTVPQSEVGTSSYNVHLNDPCCMANLKIGDFGLSCKKTDTVEWPIQTCAYRAPETFLISQISTPADMWSLGCIAYEMATQEFLFPCLHVNAQQETMDHLSKIASELGPIDASKFEMTETNWTVFKEVFGRGKVLCGKLNMNLKLSVKNLVEKSNMTMIEAEQFLDFLMQLLTLDPKERLTAKEALEHPLLMG